MCRVAVAVLGICHSVLFGGYGDNVKRGVARSILEGYAMSKTSGNKTTRKLTINGAGPVKQAPTPLTTPQPVSPVDGQHFPPYPRTLTLTWKPVQSATGYVVTVQFYSNTPQGKTWLTKPPITVAATSLTVDFPSNVPGRWCVSAVDSTGSHTPSPDSVWSNFDFTVLTLDTPTLVSPTDGQRFSNYPRKTTLTWKPVTRATEYVVTVECTNPPAPTTSSKWRPVLTSTVQTTSLTFDFVGAQPARWNVLAVDSTNNRQQSAASAWHNFTYTV